MTAFREEALIRVDADLRASNPDVVFTSHRAQQLLQNAGWLVWGSDPSDAPSDSTGLDLDAVRDSGIAALYVSFDPSAS